MLEWPNIDFDLLKRINPDTIGWIHTEDTPVNYPVVQGHGDGYYLTHNFSCEESPHGCIYALTEGEFPGKRSVVVGHNMKDETMFVSMLYYRYEEGYFEKHPVIELKTPYANYEIKVWGSIDFGEDGLCMVYPPEEEDLFNEWKEEVRRLNLFDPGFDITYDDDIMVFCTCRPYLTVNPDGTLMVVGKVIRKS